jgi:ATP-dependent DNA helicase PIF1
MDLGSNVFEYGQSYVGLSRIRTLEGLYLSGFNPQKIKTNPRVAAFYQTIGKITGEMVEEAKERDLSCTVGTAVAGTGGGSIKPFDPNIFVVRI